MRFEGEPRVFHVYAVWETWAYDHSGWNAETDLIAVNADFERRGVERFDITSTLAEFCAERQHRMPDQFWQDPRPRALDYLAHHVPPWEVQRGSPEVTG